MICPKAEPGRRVLSCTDPCTSSRARSGLPELPPARSRRSAAKAVMPCSVRVSRGARGRLRLRSPAVVASGFPRAAPRVTFDAASISGGSASATVSRPRHLRVSPVTRPSFSAWGSSSPDSPCDTRGFRRVFRPIFRPQDVHKSSPRCPPIGRAASPCCPQFYAQGAETCRVLHMRGSSVISHRRHRVGPALPGQG